MSEYTFLTEKELEFARSRRLKNKEKRPEEGTRDYFKQKIIEKYIEEMDKKDLDKSERERILDTLELLYQYDTVQVVHHDDYPRLFSPEPKILFPRKMEALQKDECRLLLDEGGYLDDGWTKPEGPFRILDVDGLRDCINKSLENEKKEKARAMVRDASIITLEELQAAKNRFKQNNKFMEIFNDITASSQFTNEQKDKLIAIVQLLKEKGIIKRRIPLSNQYVRLPEELTELPEGEYYFKVGEGLTVDPEKERNIRLAGLNSFIELALEGKKREGTVNVNGAVANALQGDYEIPTSPKLAEQPGTEIHGKT